MNNDNFIDIKIDDFCIEQTLECGQFFRFKKLDNKDYIIVAREKVLRVKQINDNLILNCTMEEYNKIWNAFFDFNRDYVSIKDTLSKKDKYLETAVKDKYGIRILQQEPWEMLISFILSQSKQIPHIKQLIENLSIGYGTFICEFDHYKYYSFPTIEQLSGITEEELRELKVGFRAPYIIDAIEKVNNKEVDLNYIYTLPYNEAKDMLCQIKGVGNKISDCILLFAYGKHEVFPVDVWVKRVMENYYFKEETNINKINDFAREYFGDLAGFAQQYLFYYARNHKIGK